MDEDKDLGEELFGRDRSQKFKKFCKKLGNFFCCRGGAYTDQLKTRVKQKLMLNDLDSDDETGK